MPERPQCDVLGERPCADDMLGNPIQAIRREHERQALACDWLAALATEAEPAPIAAEIDALLVFLTEDLVWHIADEEIDLFPSLRARCTPADGIAGIIDQLSREHDLDKDIADFLVDDLTACAARAGSAPPRRFGINAHGFAETQRRHLEWENHLILPLAQSRLTADDMRELGRNMARRRGLHLPE
ncbi:MAG: hemerythrin domain-containing protein [Kiloniellaceae bacterium]